MAVAFDDGRSFLTNTISLLAPRGNTISITAAGSGPPLILLHGFPLDRRMWQFQWSALASDFHVIVPELQGFGMSTLGQPQVSLADLADDIETVRSHLAAETRIHLCGLSMGGYVALEYWQRHRRHLAAIILANTKPGGDTQSARQGRLAMAEAAVAQGTWPAVSGMLPKLLGAGTRANSPELTARVEEIMRSAAPESVAAAQRAMADRADFTDRLSEFTLPTLVVTGEEDELAPPAATSRWAEQIPGAVFKCLPSAGHLTPLEAPREFNTTIASFLRDTARP